MAMTAYVSSNDIVRIVLSNGTGGPVALPSGRFRVYVWPRIFRRKPMQMKCKLFSYLFSRF